MYQSVDQYEQMDLEKAYEHAIRTHRIESTLPKLIERLRSIDTSSMSRPTPPPDRLKALSARNVRILLDIDRYKLLSTDQVRRLHFAHLPRTSDAARMLLSRLHRHGYLEKHRTHARSTHSGDGLSVTKPKAVWTMSSPARERLKRSLSSLGRHSEGLGFGVLASNQNHAGSFSDQSLAHEVGLSSILIALEQAIEVAPHLYDAKFLRTSPRHPITSTRLRFRLGSQGEKTAIINPDAVFFMRGRAGERDYPFLFFVEYERGTASAKDYVKNKLIGYTVLSRLMRSSQTDGNADAYHRIVNGLNEALELELTSPERLPFRVLTVCNETGHALSALAESAWLKEHTAFLFSSLESMLQNPLGPVWSRGTEFVQPSIRNSASFEAKFLEQKAKRSPKQLYQWLNEEASTSIATVTIP